MDLVLAAISYLIIEVKRPAGKRLKKHCPWWPTCQMFFPVLRLFIVNMTV